MSNTNQEKKNQPPNKTQKPKIQWPEGLFRDKVEMIENVQIYSTLLTSIQDDETLKQIKVVNTNLGALFEHIDHMVHLYGMVVEYTELPSVAPSKHGAGAANTSKQSQQSKASGKHDTSGGNNTQVQDLGKKLSEEKVKCKTLEDKLEKQLQEIDMLRSQVHDLSNRLSHEMNLKVGMDENNLENVSIKNRPLNVASEYEELRASSWLEAKGVLDRVFPNSEDSATVINLEEHKLRIICNIIVNAEKFAQAKYKELIVGIYVQICLISDTTTARHECPNAIMNVDIPTGSNKKDKLNDEAITKYLEQMPESVKLGIGDLLRVAADQVDVGAITHEITTNITEAVSTKLDGKEDATMGDIFNDENMKTFIGKCARLAWKMILQRPQMRFDFSGEGEKWKGEKIQEPFYLSRDVTDKKAVVRCYVHPAMYHGDKLMLKGTVYINIPDQSS